MKPEEFEYSMSHMSMSPVCLMSGSMGSGFIPGPDDVNWGYSLYEAEIGGVVFQWESTAGDRFEFQGDRYYLKTNPDKSFTRDGIKQALKLLLVSD